MEEKSVQNIVGGNHRISDQLGALSLVRKFNEAHAFLILEEYKAGNRIISDIHLVIKMGTENLPNKKADIVQRSRTVDYLVTLNTNGLYSVTWSVTQDQIKRLGDLLETEKKRVANNEIDYHIVGNAPAAGLVGASLQTSQSEDLQTWSVDHHNGSVSEYLLRRGHNCYSWAQAMAMNIGMKPPTSWREFFIKDPRKILDAQGVIGKEDDEPYTGQEDTGCRIF